MIDYSGKKGFPWSPSVLKYTRTDHAEVLAKARMNHSAKATRKLLRSSRAAGNAR
jgi:hypothetical protein